MPDRRGYVRRQMILSGKRRPGEIAEIKRLHLRRVRVPVLQCFLTGLYRERTEIAIRERAKRGLPDADYGYWSHTFRITRDRPTEPRPREAILTIVERNHRRPRPQMTLVAIQIVLVARILH